MKKFEIIVRETRVLKFKIEAPTEQIAVDRVITDYALNPPPYQTQRIAREIYTADITPEGGNVVNGVPWMPTDDKAGVHADTPQGLTPHPEPTPPVTVQKRKKK